jgi:hypothetical protein
MFDIKVGQTVCITQSSWYRGQPTKPLSGVIEKIGRKYFYVSLDNRSKSIKFSKEDFYAIDTFPSCRIWESSQDYYKHIKYTRISQALRQAFEVYSDNKYTLEQLEQIVHILNLRVEED